MFDVLHVASFQTSRHMGPRVSVPNLCLAESRLGYKAAVLNVIDGVLYRPDSGARGWQVSGSSRESTGRLIERSRIVHFNGIFHPRFLPLGWRCEQRGIPYVICPRSSLMRRALQDQQRLKKALALTAGFRRWIRKSRALHFLTYAEAQASATFDHPYIVAPNGVDTDGIDGPAHARSRDPFRMVFIGRLDVRHKGLDRLLNFAGRWQPLLRERGWRVELYGPDHRGGLSWLGEQIQVRGLSEDVQLLGPIAEPSKTEVLANARLFLHPSRFEGQPQAVLEALAQSCPVVLSEGTNMREEVLRAGCGYGWETFASTRAAHVLEELEHDEVVTAKGAAGLELIRLEYSWPAAARKTMSELKNLL